MKQDFVHQGPAHRQACLLLIAGAEVSLPPAGSSLGDFGEQLCTFGARAYPSSESQSMEEPSRFCTHCIILFMLGIFLASQKGAPSFA